MNHTKYEEICEFCGLLFTESMKQHIKFCKDQNIRIRAYCQCGAELNRSLRQGNLTNIDRWNRWNGKEWEQKTMYHYKEID